MAGDSILRRGLGLFSLILPRRFRSDTALVPVVRLSGVIGLSNPLRPGLTLAGIAGILERAFSFRNAKAVAILINSPGGSAVQAHLIYLRIRQLSDENKIPVLAFVEDVGASGGYMIACAADEIVCDPASIIGSIGVVGSTFGFQKLLEKIGVERRVYTAGEHKAMLDPFLPEDPEDVRRLKAIQSEVHERFIALVKSRRGPRLTGPESALFSGEYWTGSKAMEYGLVDQLGDVRDTLRQRFGDKVMTPLIADRGWFRRLPLFRTSEPTLPDRASLAEDLIAAIETRAFWARFGF